jgi:linoleoyl-CoA desaturase
MQMPRFTTSPNFYTDLKSRVNVYFEENNESLTGNWRLFSKAITIIALHIISYSVLLFVQPNAYMSLLLCAVLGLTTAAIGFNIMHDGSHGSFSKNKLLNTAAAFSLNLMGGNDYMWKVKHCVLHHSFTNVNGVDDDIDIQPFLRMCNEQEYRWFHRFQFIYVIVLYALFYVFWLFWFDYEKYFSKKIGGFDIPKMSTLDHISFWGSKLGSYFIMIVLPILMVGFMDFLIGFAIVVLITGFLSAVVFQLAHTVEHTNFPKLTEENKIENEWAIHQIQTTANFATRNPIVTWFCGGLNFQIEHHLFPKMSHIHYPKISKIVKATCQEYGINYIEFPRVTAAMRSHWKLLYDLGRK